MELHGHPEKVDFCGEEKDRVARPLSAFDARIAISSVRIAACQARRRYANNIAAFDAKPVIDQPATRSRADDPLALALEAYEKALQQGAPH